MGELQMKKGFTVILLSVFLLYRIAFPTTVVHAEEVEISAAVWYSYGNVYGNGFI